VAPSSINFNSAAIFGFDNGLAHVEDVSKNWFCDHCGDFFARATPWYRIARIQNLSVPIPRQIRPKKNTRWQSVHEKSKERLERCPEDWRD
jgi:hypothetical protein